MTAPRSQIVTYTFPATVEGWEFVGTGWSAGWSTTNPFQTADGSLQAVALAANEGEWVLRGTWQELFGIAPGQAVQQLQISLWYFVLNSGFDSWSLGPVYLGDTALTAQVVDAADGEWLNLSGSLVNVPVAMQNSSDEIEIRIPLAQEGAGVQIRYLITYVVLTAYYAGLLGRSTATYYGFQGGRAQWVSGWGQQGAGN